MVCFSPRPSAGVSDADTGGLTWDDFNQKDHETLGKQPVKGCEIQDASPDAWRHLPETMTLPGVTRPSPKVPQPSCFSYIASFLLTPYPTGPGAASVPQEELMGGGGGGLRTVRGKEHTCKRGRESFRGTPKEDLNLGRGALRAATGARAPQSHGWLFSSDINQSWL